MSLSVGLSRLFVTSFLGCLRASSWRVFSTINGGRKVLDAPPSLGLIRLYHYFPSFVFFNLKIHFPPFMSFSIFRLFFFPLSFLFCFLPFPSISSSFLSHHFANDFLLLQKTPLTTRPPPPPPPPLSRPLLRPPAVGHRPPPALAVAVPGCSRILFVMVLYLGEGGGRFGGGERELGGGFFILGLLFVLPLLSPLPLLPLPSSLFWFSFRVCVPRGYKTTLFMHPRFQFHFCLFIPLNTWYGTNSGGSARSTSSNRGDVCGEFLPVNEAIWRERILLLRFSLLRMNRQRNSTICL